MSDEISTEDREVRKRCLQGAHADSGGRLGSICIPCNALSMHDLLAANAALTLASKGWENEAKEMLARAEKAEAKNEVQFQAITRYNNRQLDAEAKVAALVLELAAVQTSALYQSTQEARAEVAALQDRVKVQVEVLKKALAYLVSLQGEENDGDVQFLLRRTIAALSDSGGKV